MRRTGRFVCLTLFLVTLPLFGVTRLVDRSNVACSDATGAPYCTIEAALDDAVDGDIVDVSGATTYDEFLRIDDEDVTVSSDDGTAPLIDPPQSWPVFQIMPTWNACINPEVDIAEPPRARPASAIPTVVLQNLRIAGSASFKASNEGPRFDGDDTIVLRKNTSGDATVYETVIDTIGQTGFDPGNEWGTGATSTQRANLIRNASNCTGKTSATTPFTPSSAYTGTALHKANADLAGELAVSDLGTHTSSCTPTDLLFSQYVESYRTRQAVEIWNGTAGTINFFPGTYRIEVYQNGSTCPIQIFDLTLSIAPGSALVLTPSDSGFANTLTYDNFEGTSLDEYAGGAVSVERATVTLNSIEAYNGGICDGGAIANDFGNVTINDSNIHDNDAACEGSAIYNSWATTTINDSTIASNPTEETIFNNQGTILINRSLIENNTPSNYGGVIHLEAGDVTLTDSVVRNNSGSAGAMIANDNGNVMLLRSTVSGNSTVAATTNSHDGYRAGGGIEIEHFGTLTATNSTISGNSTNGYGGGVHLLGEATFDHVTFYNNVATLGGSQIWADLNVYDDGTPIPLSQQGPKTGADQGDTFDCDDENPTGCDTPYLELACAPNCFGTSTTATNLPALVVFQNTIFATTGTDPCGGGGTYTSLGNNLVYPTDAGCGADEASDINGTDPVLLPLAANGGEDVGHTNQPMQTHSFAYSSPLFDNGAVTEPEDQRGEYRPQGITSDIGAVEIDAVNVTGVKSVSGNFVPGGAITYTIVLTNNGNVDQPNNPGDEFIDVVPSQIDVTGADDGGNPGTINVSGNTVTWNGGIAAGTSVTITITGTIKPDASGTISNTGTINFDPTGDGTNDATFGTGAPATGGPTVIALATAAAIPALSGFALMLMATALGMAALIAMRFRV